MIIRDSAYTPPGCPATSLSSCAGVDPFYQVTYRVYLRYVVDDATPDSMLTFDLNYSRLNARVQLLSQKGLSFIDNSSSYSCFTAGPASNWDLTDKVIWDIQTPNEIALDLMNETANPVVDCGASDARIHFSPNAPSTLAPPLHAEPCHSGYKCTYVYLFPVVVQAYPGDTIRLECAGLEYQSNDPSVPPCHPPVCHVNTNNYKHNGAFPYPVPLPPAPSGDNTHLQVRLTAPVNSASVSGALDVGVNIVNTGNAAITVNYLEFMVKMDNNVPIPEPVFANYAPKNIRKVKAGAATYDYYMAYVIRLASGLTLNPNASYTLSTITVGPNMPTNQNGEGHIALINAANSRVRSQTECSSLLLSDTVRVLQWAGGNNPCGNLMPDSVFFTIRGQSDSTGSCTPPKILMGFYSTVPYPVQMLFDYFECEVEFDWTGDLEISNVNFINGWECGGDDCTSPCYIVDANNNKLLRIRICKTNYLTLDANNNYEAFFEVEFQGFGCVTSAIPYRLLYQREKNNPYCVPPYDNLHQALPVCGRRINGIIKTENDKFISDVTVFLDTYTNTSNCDSTACPKDSTLTNSAGEFALCACTTCDTFVVRPYKNNDPLNGVSTLDLVLINKQILGIEPLGSPYKRIAADVNNSMSLTTFDIVELRKLILGIYTTFPNNNSWRFIRSGYNFPNPLIPFPFPEADTLPPASPDFIGIKVGDVNNNAVTNRPENRPATTVAWPAFAAKGAKTLTVPLVYTGLEPLEAIQMGLRFDPGVLELIGPSQGDLSATTAGNFGLTRADAGEVRMLWMPDGTELEPYIQPGAILFYLSFRLRAPLPPSGLPLWVDDQVLESLAWRPDATEYALLGETLPAENRFDTAPAGALQASCRPNPTASEAIFSIHAPRAGQGRIALFDAFGKLVFMRKVALEAGDQEIPAPEVGPVPAGIYVWKVFAGAEKVSGHLIKS